MAGHVNINARLTGQKHVAVAYETAGGFVSDTFEKQQLRFKLSQTKNKVEKKVWRFDRSVPWCIISCQMQKKRIHETVATYDRYVEVAEKSQITDNDIIVHYFADGQKERKLEKR